MPKFLILGFFTVFSALVSAQSNRILKEALIHSGNPDDTVYRFHSYHANGAVKETILRDDTDDPPYRNVFTADTLGRLLSRSYIEADTLRTLYLLDWVSRDSARVKTIWRNGQRTDTTHGSTRVFGGTPAGGMPDSTRLYDEKNRLLFHTSVRKDDHGNPVEQTEIFLSDTTRTLYRNFYDGVGRLTKSLEWKEGSEDTTTRWCFYGGSVSIRSLLGPGKPLSKKGRPRDFRIDGRTGPYFGGMHNLAPFRIGGPAPR